MTERRRLNLKLILSVFFAFAVSMAITWVLHDALAERNANDLILRSFESVEDEINDVVDERLIRQAMRAREELAEPGADLSVPAMRDLAEQLQVSQIHVADAKGLLVAGTNPEWNGSFDFSTATGQAAEFMCLARGDETELSQRFQANTATGEEFKYVGVWRPQGGFVQIGCDLGSLRRLVRSSLVGLFTNWDVGNGGGIVITTPEGLVLSGFGETADEGAHWEIPGASFYWQRHEIAGFPVYVLIPRASAAVQRDVLVGATACLTALALAFVAILVGVVISSFVKRQFRAQAAKEMKMATDIQLAALPSVFPPFPSESRFDIWAAMTTAREVGGDFYDFYYTGADHILFLVADVSGKGIPAALFMMRAKTLIKGAAQTGKSIAHVFDEANDALCEGNASNTFVTAWAGEIDLATGRITCVNAGHNPPVLRRNGKAAFLKSPPSLVLGAMPGFEYRAQELRLEPGDELYLYTDGVTEQPDAAGALFGETRLLAALGESGLHQKPLLDAVAAAVRAHAGGTEQADDCTQLVVRYRGPVETALDRAYAPTMEALARATGDLEAALEGRVPMKTQMSLMVAADEIFANIVRHSKATEWSLRVTFARHPDAVTLAFTDNGLPFDPLAKRDPDTTLSAEERAVGGLGILIVKKTMSPVTYARANGRNVLTMGLTYGT